MGKGGPQEVPESGGVDVPRSQRLRDLGGGDRVGDAGEGEAGDGHDVARARCGEVLAPRAAALPHLCQPRVLRRLACERAPSSADLYACSLVLALSDCFAAVCQLGAYILQAEGLRSSHWDHAGLVGKCAAAIIVTPPGLAGR